MQHIHHQEYKIRLMNFYFNHFRLQVPARSTSSEFLTKFTFTSRPFEPTMADQFTDLTYLSQFRFLQTIPYIEALEQSDDDHCFICKEPYNVGSREWVPGGLHDFPVRLPCRHVLGNQCLARWILSPNFDNHCCLCRARIIPELDKETLLDDAMDFLWLIICFQMGFSPAVKEAVLSAISVLLESGPNTRTARIGKDRTMMLFEEFLDHFAREDRLGRLEGFQPPRVTQRRGAGAEQAVGQGPVAPRPRLMSVLKRILFSLYALVLCAMFAFLSFSLCRRIQVVVNSRGGIDVVVSPELISVFNLLVLVELGLIGSALPLVLAELITG